MNTRFSSIIQRKSYSNFPTGNTQREDRCARQLCALLSRGSPHVHSIRNLAHSKNLVAVEWSLEAVHMAVLPNLEATDKKVQVPGAPFTNTISKLKDFRPAHLLRFCDAFCGKSASKPRCNRLTSLSSAIPEVTCLEPGSALPCPPLREHPLHQLRFGVGHCHALWSRPAYSV